jgi:two-component system, OmpR family, copper resistance phosphate regulon response regulator CusR
MRILVIEDEKKVAKFISRGLREAGYSVDVCHDGSEGRALAVSGGYGLIILDIMLPGHDGYQILAELRRLEIASKVLLLSALDQTQNKIKGLNLGADDYLTKPFDFEELLARINALLRRGNYEAREQLAVADLVLDNRGLTVERGGRRIELTQREFLLLKYLLEHKHEVVTRTMIAQNVWNLGLESSTNVIDVYINYLRRKIDDGFETKLIQTVRGRGYILGDAE